MNLVKPTRQLPPDYVEALSQGWSPDNVRPEVAKEQLDAIGEDPDAFISRLEDREATGSPIVLPDGTSVPRLPGFTRWIWDDGFCGSIGLRWQSGTEELPPHCLGHVGYAVVPWRRGQGLASAALVAMLADVRLIGLRYIELTTSPDNAASRRAIERAGGVLVERFHKTAAYGGGEALRFRITISNDAMEDR
jgi:predicted acetyltransferase